MLSTQAKTLARLDRANDMTCLSAKMSQSDLAFDTKKTAVSSLRP
ncbi:hypothetical protein HMPREF1574_01302 [Gardnerella pickettii JCP7659]|nr:hypothetical protein HMPREF1574_01302 [Gardnerella pickettii JCP7659]EPI59590.1 hypothetical protein HMPREF1578_01299 [Gardnerella pickettii JCP8017B]